jgi:hypothetical protein
MDALLRKPGKLSDLVVIREAQLEPRGADAQAEERRQVYCRTLT